MDLLKQFYKGQNPNAPENKVKKKPVNSWKTVLFCIYMYVYN
jgi:hypothetical protein